ncbi:MAG: AAA family ATPase [Candidatus Altiarchaeota archaeon]
MRFNKVQTRAYAIASDVMQQAVYDVKAGIQARIGASENFRIEGKYAPVLKMRASQHKEVEGQKILTGVSNTLHVDLTDLSLYYRTAHNVEGKFKKFFDKQYVEYTFLNKSNILVELLKLSPPAMKMLGYLIEYGTTKFDMLDINQQDAAREIVGKKMAVVFSPTENESTLKTLVREITDWDIITKIYYIKPVITAPKFTSKGYDISSGLLEVDYIEDSFHKMPIRHTPDKIAILLSQLFTCKLTVEEIVYMPFLECTYLIGGEDYVEVKYLPCIEKSNTLWEYPNKKAVKTLTLGTKGYGLDSIPVESEAINFSNVAGMNRLKEHIREAIIYPLTHPHLSEEFGRKAGGGVLFYGPPGCGKTYIARATVGECGYNFYSFSIQDIMGDNPEVAASKLHQAFQEARDGVPSILFFDELDALGRARGSTQGAERLVINQFLAEMEGVDASNENMLVIGSTNAPWDIDPALRRAGRFTLQVFVPPPDNEARVGLFNIHTKGRPLSEDVDFGELARITEGYSSADITAICDESSQIPWGETIHGGAKRKITLRDFRMVIDQRESTIIPWLRVAEKQIRDSGEEDVYPELAEYVLKRAGGINQSIKPSLNFSDVGGLSDVKEEIKVKVVYPLKNPELSKEYGREVGGAILLYGPPGCGKTYLARASAGECESSFFNVKITDLMSHEEGVTEKRLHSIFERAARNTPSIIFFDEIDAVASKRSVSQKGAERRLVNQLLTEMDGFEKRKGVMILGATNAPWDIDPALRRAGRFSDQIYIPSPDMESRVDIFKLHSKGKPVSDEIDFVMLAEMTAGFSSADIKVICDEASEIPWKESMESGLKRPVGMDDFVSVLSNRKSSIIPWFLQARSQLMDSGERELYSKLWDDINNFLKTNQGGDDGGPVVSELSMLLGKRSDLMRMINKAKEKYHKRELSEEMYHELMTDYQKKIIEVETNLEKKGKR